MLAPLCLVTSWMRGAVPHLHTPLSGVMKASQGLSESTCWQLSHTRNKDSSQLVRDFSYEQQKREIRHKSVVLYSEMEEAVCRLREIESTCRQNIRVFVPWRIEQMGFPLGKIKLICCLEMQRWFLFSFNQIIFYCVTNIQTRNTSKIWRE
jgi:hypothetical protein